MELQATTEDSSSMPVKKGTLKRRSTTRVNAGGPSKPSKKSKLCLIRQEPDRKPGLVLTVGAGDTGQLGLGPDIMEKKRAGLVSNLKDVVAIAAGGMHTVCLTESGEVITFGCNDEGALGRDTSVEGSETEPGKVNLDDLNSKVVQITAGDSHTAILLEDGRVYAWGSFRDASGSMGLTSAGVEKKPVEMLPRIKVIKIASGVDHLVMLSEEGQLYTCGCGEQGQLGRVSERGANRGSRQGMGHLLTPALVTFKPRQKPTFEDIWAGSYATYAKEKSKGDIYVFGLNNYYQLGLPLPNSSDVKVYFHPTISTGFAGKEWTQIAAAEHHCIALDSEGIVHALGRKEYGRLGLGKDCEETKEPTVIPALKNKKCVFVACGSSVSFAITESGQLYGWGMGTSNQLGMGDDDDDIYEPRLVQGKQLESRSVISVSAGGQHTVIHATSGN